MLGGRDGGVNPTLRVGVMLCGRDGGVNPALRRIARASEGSARPRGGAQFSTVLDLSCRGSARSSVARTVTKRPPGERSGAARAALRPHRAWDDFQPWGECGRTERSVNASRTGYQASFAGALPRTPGYFRQKEIGRRG